MITKVVIYLAVLALSSFALSQRPEGASTNSSPSHSQLPDAPVPRSGRIPEMSDWRGDPSSAEQEPDALPQTKRILGVVPNFRSVDADTKLRPQTVKEKFSTGLEDSFDYSFLSFSSLRRLEPPRPRTVIPRFGRELPVSGAITGTHLPIKQMKIFGWNLSFLQFSMRMIVITPSVTVGYSNVRGIALSRALFVTRNDGGNVDCQRGRDRGSRYCCWHIVCVLPGRIPYLDEDRSTLADKYCLG